MEREGNYNKEGEKVENRMKKEGGGELAGRPAGDGKKKEEV